MQIRCNHCHKPFALRKEEVLAALDMLQAQNLHHYNAYCPHCRRANRISKDELQHAAPEWKPTKKQSDSSASE
ncbi:MAG: hypothetical protein ACPL3P_06645 [Anaerolineales bacterium]